MSEHQAAASSLRETRRDFLKTSAAAAGAAVAGGLAVSRAVHAAGSDILKVGLVGCGGRGSGAAVDALTADPHTKLVAMHDGAIGQIVALEETCNTGSLRWRPRQPGWTEMEYQIRDWYDFFWLSCDLPGLNLVHDLDKGAWAMRDEPPVRCWGMGGRQTRLGPRFGDVWDHFSIAYEYASGARMFAYCRQQDGCASDISDRFYGTKGRCDLLRLRIDGEKPWRYAGPDCDRFTLEHVALFSAIRSGKPINNGLYMARSSMLAIMATWACYTGEVITWEQAMKSNHAVAPERLALDADPPTRPDVQGNYPMPVPGLTKFA